MVKKFKLIALSSLCLIFFFASGSHALDFAIEENGVEYASAFEEFSYFYGIDKNVIISASKTEEKPFESPISSTVISAGEIDRAGVTTIPEALRLSPGLFVYEVTNGNFDIHIRGLNNLPPNSTIMEAPNTITLVMIDGRPVFNYFSGGTIWETLPVDIHDVERIEVVRGASSALYGPNAASGVVNIITKRMNKNGFYTKSIYQGGNYSTHAAGSSAGYNFGSLSIIASGNYQKRERFSNTYYDIGDEIYFDKPENLSLVVGPFPLSMINEKNDIDKLYPDPDLSLEKKGGNVFTTFEPDKNIKIDLSCGYQSSTAQSALIENGSTSLSFRESETYYTHLITEAFGFSGQFSYLGGNLDTLVGFENDAWAFDTDNIEGTLEYNYKWKKIILRPGISMRRATYESEYINGKHSLTDSAASLRAEYTPLSSWRIITALRCDKYNHPDDPYISYQFTSTYKFNDENILRASHSMAHNESFFHRAYTNYMIESNSMFLEGNPDLDLVTVRTSEIGYRNGSVKNVETDIAFFYNTAENLTRSFRHPDPEGQYSVIITYDNVSTKAEQIGSTLSVNFGLKSLQVKLFGTLQKTRIENYLDLDGNNIGDIHKYKGTPQFFGGCNINYRPILKLNLNLNCYYADGYTFDYKDIPGSHNAKTQISKAITLNSKVTYYIWRESSLFVNCRNILNREERQFTGGDRISLMVLGGGTLEI